MNISVLIFTHSYYAYIAVAERSCNANSLRTSLLFSWGICWSCYEMFYFWNAWWKLVSLAHKTTCVIFHKQNLRQCVCIQH